MKIVSLVLLATAAHGFAPVARPARTSFVTVPRMADSTTTEPASDFASAMPAATNPYERLGVSQDNVAMGVDVNEILQWIGTRDEIVEMFLGDNKSFDQARAELEVDKFLMDAEMMSAYINYQKKKESGALGEEGDASLANPRIFGTYAAWFFGIFFFNYFRKTYIDPKFASGEWEPISIPGFGGGGGDAAADAVTSSVAETTTQTLASVQSAIDTISDAM